MQTILNQLGEMLLGSVPTVFFFLVLLAAYAVLVRRPLDKVLAERHARTGGAMDDAHKAIHSAEQETTVYETRLREARAEIFAARAARQKEASATRDKILAQAREAAQQRTTAARDSVESAGAEARQQLEAGADALTEHVIAAVLPHRKPSGMGLAR